MYNSHPSLPLPPSLSPSPPPPPPPPPLPLHPLPCVKFIVLSRLSKALVKLNICCALAKVIIDDSLMQVTELNESTQTSPQPGMFRDVPVQVSPRTLGNMMNQGTICSL